MKKVTIVIALLLIFNILTAKVEIPITRTNIPPKIDGIIDDDAWKNLKPLPELVTYNPVEGQKPEENTDVYITYDDNYFYLAFVCYDSDISQLRATIAPREAWEYDDLVTFVFDTFNSNRGGYVFNINPYGNPKDMISSTSGYMDKNWNIILHIGTKIYDDRWTVEVAVPFNSLNFDDSKDEQEWGFYYFRIDKKNNQFSIYPPRSRKISNIFVQSGVLKGLRGIKSGKNLELLPYLFSSYFNQENTEYNYDTGLNVSYSLSSKLTLSATLNPDYSQIEADPLNIEINQRNLQELEEKRPFFSQGMDIFNTGMMNIVYTRNIVNPVAAFKSIGKYPDFNLGILSALDRGIDNKKKDLYNFIRIKKNILKESSIGLISTFKDELEKKYSNRVLALDAVLAFPNNNTLKLLSAYSITKYEKEIEDSTYHKIDESSFALQLNFARSSEFTYNELWINSFPEKFKLGSGFLDDDKIGRRELGINNVLFFRNITNYWNELEWYIGANTRFNMQNKLVEKYAWTGFEFDWKKNAWNKIGLNLNHDHIREKDFHTAQLEFNLWKRITGQFDFWIDSSVGSKPYIGDKKLDWKNSFTGWHYYLTVGFNAKILNRISISPNIEREDFYYFYKGKRKYYSYNIRNKITWMIAKKLHLRNITQGKYVWLNFLKEYGIESTIDKNFSTGFLLSYEYSPLSNIYFGCNLNNISNYNNIFGDIQIFFKINYLWSL
ncbi:MAG: carbohydrate binding family 9 domain-containing protein [Candidatus Cloacimonetes bacterium]|nr:carbohydrate binding family 9 domain-containing protein [Candidatus Cloacimonadota bacterium]